MTANFLNALDDELLRSDVNGRSSLNESPRVPSLDDGGSVDGVVVAVVAVAGAGAFVVAFAVGAAVAEAVEAVEATMVTFVIQYHRLIHGILQYTFFYHNSFFVPFSICA